MRVALVTHPSSFEHVPPPGHPERPARIVAAVDGVAHSGLTVVEVEAEPAANRELVAVHDEVFVSALASLSAEGGGSIDADTYVSPGSWGAAVNAAGAGATAVRTLEAGKADVGFVAMRPPGHHAEADRAMGFCLLNNVAVTAAQLVTSGQRVAIVDWDVHHGNGTQAIMAANPDVLYMSLHQYPFYPGTGRADEIGEGEGMGATVNIPMPGGADGAIYEEAFARVIVPIVEQFGPDWLLVSAGYDAHTADPLAGIRLVDDDFAMMASALAPVLPAGRTVFWLEGGYDLDAIRGSVSATLRGHADQSPGRRFSSSAGGSADHVLDRAVEALSPYWDVG
ncbi:MAG: histone deacetylase family protein [Acidimicrobiia bacterium]|nr:MAG: histone deacetylase family protein [Acidimicrobiia bacterium]